MPNYADVQRLTTGAAIMVEGELVASQGKGQSWEVVAEKIKIIGVADDTYPLQKVFARDLEPAAGFKSLWLCLSRAQPARLRHS